MFRTFANILVALIFYACITRPKAYDVNHPANAWTADCDPQNVQGLYNWVFLKCTLTNRSSEQLTLQPLHVIRSERDIWRQPHPEELQQLKRDLQTHRNTANLPPFLGVQGGDRWESFLAQVLVVSGVWMIKSRDKTEVPEATSSETKVEPGKSLDQIFVLYRESQERPAFVVLHDQSGKFEKSVKIAKDPGTSRQRPTLP